MNPDDPTIEHTWNARGLRTIIVLYVVAVFMGFIALAHFVFDSVEGVKALFLAAIGSVGALIPSILMRIEYQLTETGLAKRPFKAKQPREFEDVFSWDQLSHLIPTKSGFRFYRNTEGPSSFLRFFRRHLSSDYSGEFHVELEDRDRVRAIIDQHGIPISKPSTAGRVGPDSQV